MSGPGGCKRTMHASPCSRALTIGSAGVVRMSVPLRRLSVTAASREEWPASYHGRSQLDPRLLEEGPELGLVDRLVVGLLGVDHLALHEVDQRVVHRGHALGARGLHHREQLEGLLLADEV